MGVSIYKKLSMKYRKVLNFTYVTYFGFLQRYKTPSFEENKIKHQDCYKHIFFHQFFFKECKKLKKGFKTEVIKNLIHWYEF